MYLHKKVTVPGHGPFWLHRNDAQFKGIAFLWPLNEFDANGNRLVPLSVNSPRTAFGIVDGEGKVVRHHEVIGSVKELEGLTEADIYAAQRATEPEGVTDALVAKGATA